jgi:GTP-binding protein
MLQKSKKPVILAVNKCDTPGPVVYEFYNLGLGEPYAISAIHGLGVGELMDACFDMLPTADGEEDSDEVIGVAIIGKPNVGKSSLLKHGRFTLIDTAGMRKKSKIDSSVEHYSAVRSVMAVGRADVCLVMIDAAQGVTEQDARIAGLAHDGGKASLILVNKWDAVSKRRWRNTSARSWRLCRMRRWLRCPH